MKKYFYYTIISIIIFIISFIILFPYTTYSRYIINRMIAKYSNIIHYQKLNSNLLYTDIQNIKLYINGKIYTIKSITINHNPLLLIKREVLIISKPLKLTLKVKKRGQKLYYNGKFNLSFLKSYFKINSIKGCIIIVGNLNLLTKNGIIQAKVNKLILSSKILKLNLSNLVTSILINRNKITIKDLKAQGVPKLDITGDIILNTHYISMSPINIRIKISSASMTRYINISGTVFNPQIIY